VVVTAGAGDGETEEGAANGIDVFFPFIGDGGLDDVGRELQFFEIGGAETEEAESGQISRGTAGEVIGSELAEDKLIVGQVVIEGLHHPVAVKIGVAGGVEPRGDLVHVTGKIEPVARPALAVVGAGEELVDLGFVGLGVVFWW
jgi:hypothetical protein